MGSKWGFYPCLLQKIDASFTKLIQSEDRMANQSPELLCLKGGSGEVVEKKSRFIAQVSPVKNEEEALQFIARIRKENRDARHNCYAYVTGPDGSIEKFSDDGEPSKTAGMPMLDLLRKRGLKNVCVVVTRYFGGILLGTGGLVRAYTAACTAGMCHRRASAGRPGHLDRGLRSVRETSVSGGGRGALSSGL